MIDQNKLVCFLDKRIIACEGSLFEYSPIRNISKECLDYAKVCVQEVLQTILLKIENGEFNE